MVTIPCRGRLPDMDSYHWMVRVHGSSHVENETWATVWSCYDLAPLLISPKLSWFPPFSCVCPVLLLSLFLYSSWAWLPDSRLLMTTLRSICQSTQPACYTTLKPVQPTKLCQIVRSPAVVVTLILHFDVFSLPILVSALLTLLVVQDHHSLQASSACHDLEWERPFVKYLMHGIKPQQLGALS